MTEHPAPRLSIDGPHDPDSTRAVADLTAEAIRVLNHATRDPDGLAYPSDVDAILASLTTALDRFPQALEQCGQWLLTEAGEERLRVTDGSYTASHPLAAAAATFDDLRIAVAFIRSGAEALDRARQITSVLAANPVPELSNEPPF